MFNIQIHSLVYFPHNFVFRFFSLQVNKWNSIRNSNENIATMDATHPSPYIPFLLIISSNIVP